MLRRLFTAGPLQGIRSALDALGGLLPGQCAVCRDWQAARLCARCKATFAPAQQSRCGRCARYMPAGIPTCGACLRHPPAFDACFAAVDYAYPWDQLVTKLKFHQALDLATPLAQCMLQSLPDDLGGADCVLPVPLSAERLASRGYNQAWELARRLAAWRGLEAQPQPLKRVRDTAHQLALKPGERAANVRDAFRVEPRLRSRLAGRHVALVDDVLTTGATAEEIARVLKRSGAASVQVWVLARTSLD